MENLNKDNFWNQLHERFPDAVNHFCKWIDEYKKEVNWNKLFNAGIQQALQCDGLTTAPKFHELPFEMQNGILARYELELFNNSKAKGKEEYVLIADNYKRVLENIFKDLQLTINRRSIELN